MTKEELKRDLIKELKSKNIDIGKVERAYDVANFLHLNQFRKGGDPYIIHPLEVALILAKLNFDIDVVCAALLHDTVEDCDYSIEQLRSEFGVNVAEIVDSVSAIDKADYIYDNNDIYENEEFVKFSAEEQTFKKLISFSKKNPLGFFVKFADRLQNLRTIDVFPRFKQLEKVKETERWILPLAKALNSRYFYDEIKNECFKILNNSDDYYFEQYNFYVNSAKSNFEMVEAILKEQLTKDIFKTVLGETIKEYQVFKSIQARTRMANTTNITQGQILKVPNYKIFLLHKTILKNAVSDFLNKIPMFEQNGLKLIGENRGSISNLPHFRMVDKYKNIYLIYFVTEQQYYEHQIGTTQGQNIELIDDDNTHKVVTSFIKVRTRSNEIKFLPEGSTVLDFAFKIHQDIGLSFKYAILNDGKTKFPAYTVLNNNDKVDIITEKNKHDELEIKAEIKWFAYIETDYAKKLLIRYFERKK